MLNMIHINQTEKTNTLIRHVHAQPVMRGCKWIQLCLKGSAAEKVGDQSCSTFTRTLLSDVQRTRQHHNPALRLGEQWRACQALCWQQTVTGGADSWRGQGPPKNLGQSSSGCHIRAPSPTATSCHRCAAQGDRGWQGMLSAAPLQPREKWMRHLWPPLSPWMEASGRKALLQPTSGI